MEKAPDIQVDLKAKGVVMTFGLYTFKDELSGLEYYLYSNKAPNGTFLSSVKNFDFILVVKHDEDSVDVPYIVEKLRLVEEFQATLHVNQLSSKDNKLVQKYI